MFTGLVEATGVVRQWAPGARAWRLELATPLAAELALGESLAVNGCCLTVAAMDGGAVAFDLLAETVRATSFAGLRPGQRVNLERALRADARLGGHFVSGHVDAPGGVAAFEAVGQDRRLAVEVPAEFRKYLVYKGSVAVDGVSLTVAEVTPDGFAVWLIPHTLAVTNLGKRGVGDRVNLEFDLLAKYVERLLAAR